MLLLRPAYSRFFTRGEALLYNHRLLWVSYPAFHRNYEDTKTASAHLSAFAFRSASITSVTFNFLATANGECVHRLGPC